MAVQAALLVAGGIKLYGQMQANKAEAEANKLNAAFYAQQAKQAQDINKIEQANFDIESRQFLGSQVSAFAKAGVDMSGSALLRYATTKAQISNESAQIAANGRANAEGFLFKAKQAKQESDRLSSAGHNLLQVASVAADTYSSVAAVD